MRSMGVVVMSFFAAIWWGLGLSAAGQTSMPILGAGVLVSLALVTAAFLSERGVARSVEFEHRINAWRRLVGIASAAEGVAILIAVNILNWLDLSTYRLSAIAVIVGLHFVPLARMPHAGFYRWTALALMTLGIAGCALPETLRALVVGTGAALLIWATCIVVISSFWPRRLASALSARG